MRCTDRCEPNLCVCLRLCAYVWYAVRSTLLQPKHMWTGHTQTYISMLSSVCRYYYQSSQVLLPKHTHTPTHARERVCTWLRRSERERLNAYIEISIWRIEGEMKCQMQSRLMRTHTHTTTISPSIWLQTPRNCADSLTMSNFIRIESSCTGHNSLDKLKKHVCLGSVCVRSVQSIQDLLNLLAACACVRVYVCTYQTWQPT